METSFPKIFIQRLIGFEDEIMNKLKFKTSL
ncbi:hypothetical protein GQ627_004705 [Klebsiella pneumoniae]|nr:hypothetical protein GQ627_004705 [Klebsiella pneumoniae]